MEIGDKRWHAASFRGTVTGADRRGRTPRPPGPARPLGAASLPGWRGGRKRVFLESGFLGLYLFGRNRVPRWLHWTAALMVAVGATLSAFWIIVANSWKQTPAGHIIQNGHAELVDFWAAVFNPSTLVRYSHTLLAALTSGAFLMAGIAAWLGLKGKVILGDDSY